MMMMMSMRCASKQTLVRPLHGFASPDRNGFSTRSHAPLTTTTTTTTTTTAAAAAGFGGCRRRIQNRYPPHSVMLNDDSDDNTRLRLLLGDDTQSNRNPDSRGRTPDEIREEFCLRFTEDEEEDGEGECEGVDRRQSSWMDDDGRSDHRHLAWGSPWNGVTNRDERDFEPNTPDDVISARAQKLWFDLERQDSGSGEAAELYSFEDYITPMMSPAEPTEYRCTEFMYRSGSTSYTVRTSREEGASAAVTKRSVEATTPEVKVKGGTSLFDRTGIENLPVSSLESLSLNHKISYFFKNCTSDGVASSPCSYEDICGRPVANRHTSSASSCFLSFDKTVLSPNCLAADDSVQFESRKPLYYTTPPLSQIPRRCAIKHKRKLIRSNTLSANSVHRKPAVDQDSAAPPAKEICRPAEKYNSDGSLAAQFGGTGGGGGGGGGGEWPNSTGIHGSLSLPNRLNEDADAFLEGFESEPPNRPTNVTLCVTSGRSLLVTFSPPSGHSASEITSYSVEWSQCPGFQSLAGNHVVSDPSECCYEIRDLRSGYPYYVQVRAFNQRGAGPASISSPCYAIPSDWKEIDNVTPRTEWKRQLLDDLYGTIRNKLNDPLRTGSQLMKTSPAWKKKVRNTFRSLFSSAPKFQKTAKSGIYLALLISHEDRILVTNDDVIPIVEIDSEYMPTSANLNADLQWLSKVACNWYNAKVLRQLLHKMGLSDVSTSPFRRNLLQVVLQLQIVLGIKDLGQFYHQPTRDAASGAVVLTTVCCLNDPKSVNTTYVRWIPMVKMQKRTCLDAVGGELNSSTSIPLNDEELSSASSPPQTSLNFALLRISRDMIDYSTGSTVRLEKGLYLGYLKLESSLDQILVMVDRCQPNVLPAVKIRENHHVSREEWSVIRQSSESQSSTEKLSDGQQIFRRHLIRASIQLFRKLGMDESQAIRDHRFYHLEVLELSCDVSMIVLLPAPDQICTGPGQRDEVPPPDDCINIPLPAFEMLNLRTYHLDLVRRYSQLSNFLEIDLRVAQQELRMGISDEDMRVAQGRVDVLTELVQRLEDSWREMRWVADMVTRARDKSVRCGTEVEDLAFGRSDGFTSLDEDIETRLRTTTDAGGSYLEM